MRINISRTKVMLVIKKINILVTDNGEIVERVSTSIQISEMDTERNLKK